MQTLLKRSSRALAQLSQRQRYLHIPKTLHFDVEQGLGDFISPEGCKMVAHDFQHGLLDRVNELVLGTQFENMDLAQTVIQTSSSREHALLFKYASLALNNDFFLANLKPPSEASTTTLSNELALKVTQEFGGKSHLQSSMAAAADGMSSSGWIWLVSDQQGSLGVVPTYGAGTILVRARQQRIPPIRGELHELPPNSSDTRSLDGQIKEHTLIETGQINSPASGVNLRPPKPLFNRGQTRSVVTSSLTLSDVNPSGGRIDAFIHDDRRGSILNPLFCISVYEHAWLGSGYGIWGKKEYLRRFWSVLDWDQVSKSYEYWNKFGQEY